MSDKIMWTVESYLKGRIYGVFSSKKQAVDAIRLWAGSSHPYRILRDLDTINLRQKSPERIGIEYIENNQNKVLYVNYHNLNNGAGIIYARMDDEG